MGRKRKLIELVSVQRHYIATKTISVALLLYPGLGLVLLECNVWWGSKSKFNGQRNFSGQADRMTEKDRRRETHREVDNDKQTETKTENQFAPFRWLSSSRQFRRITWKSNFTTFMRTRCRAVGLYPNYSPSIPQFHP